MHFTKQMSVETWAGGKLSITIDDSDVVAWMEPKFLKAREYGELFAAAPEILETLDNVTAIVETLVVAFGHKMSPIDEASRNGIARAARALVDRFNGTCCGCDGSGIRPDAGYGTVKAPEGYVIVERCDSCERFEDDLSAAIAWGRNAMWFEGHSFPGGSVAIAMPKASAPETVMPETATL